MLRTAFLGVSVVILLASLAEGQRAGQSAKVSIGTVTKVEDIDLRSQQAPAGALVGGMLAYHTTGNSRSSSTKWGRAAAGAIAGGAIARAREGDLSGKVYTVDIGNRQSLQVVSDQREIRQGDCVAVEEVKGKTNVRRIDGTACAPESDEVLFEPAVDEHFQEEAAECSVAKDELLAAETPEQFELAERKMNIFCN